MMTMIHDSMTDEYWWCFHFSSASSKAWLLCSLKLAVSATEHKTQSCWSGWFRLIQHDLSRMSRKLNRFRAHKFQHGLKDMPGWLFQVYITRAIASVWFRPRTLLGAPDTSDGSDLKDIDRSDLQARLQHKMALKQTQNIFLYLYYCILM